MMPPRSRLVRNASLPMVALALCAPSTASVAQDEPSIKVPHSPWLALRFEQAGRQVSIETQETIRSRVALARKPFTIVFPAIDENERYALSASTSPNIFEETVPFRGRRRDDEPKTPSYFGGGTGMADTAASSGELFLKDTGHHSLSGLRLGPDPDRPIFHVAAMGTRDAEGKRKVIPIEKYRGTVYLVAWFDKNSNKAMDYGEYEQLVLSIK